ncbi:trehalose-phosphatase [Limibacillus halophilus]|jgi:trehalose 6-phosphate phosphatase
MALPQLDNLEALAVFLDFDGTLVEIAERPEGVLVPPELRSLLARLSGALGGALAIVTGREIDAIDRFLPGLSLPVAGIHGLVRRSADGHLHQPPEGAFPLERVASRLEPLLERGEGLLLEPKGASLALHYRARPELEGACLEAMERATGDLADVTLLHGKCVIEAKPKGYDKGRAVQRFLAEPPFQGRQPLYAGDDVTDEDAFGVVEALGGLTIKVGEGETKARYRAASPEVLADWLRAALEEYQG